MSKPPPIEEFLRQVAVVHYSGQEACSYEGWQVQRLRHGMNNALYRVEFQNTTYACKLCVPDERRRANREYGALTLVAQLDIAPRPLHLDESCTILPYPAVVYAWLEGEALGPQVTQAQLEALLESIQRIHSCRPGEAVREMPTAWFHWFDLSPYLSELHELLEQYGPWLSNTQPGGNALYHRLERVLEVCEKHLLSSKVKIHRESVALCLSHVDPNLANTILGNNGKIRWVDWEFSGWGDPALDLAEFRWHQALDGVTHAQKAWMRQQYTPPPGDSTFANRLAFWDCLLSTRWPLIVLRALWSAYNGPDRLRLTMHPVEPGILRTRLEKMIEGAEDFQELG